MNNQIQIQGRSGCPINISEKEGVFRVRKYAGNEAYNKRLLLQIAKQDTFFKHNTLDGFTAPQVLDQGTENNLVWFEMPYINAEKYSNYLVKQNKQALDNFVQTLFNYFNHLHQQATPFASEKLIQQLGDKITEVSHKIKQNTWLEPDVREDIVSFLQQQQPEAALMEATCHGDFTLSNMLFTNNNRVYLIDFLDSFIESPWIDFVKLRQDTRFHWSLHLEGEAIENATRLEQVLRYIDENICRLMYKQYPELQTWERYLTVLNFCRIVPYAHESDQQYLNKQLKNVLTNW